MVDTYSRLVSLEDQLCLNQDETNEVIHIKGELSKTLEHHSLTIDSQDGDLYKQDGHQVLHDWGILCSSEGNIWV